MVPPIFRGCRKQPKKPRSLPLRSRRRHRSATSRRGPRRSAVPWGRSRRAMVIGKRTAAASTFERSRWSLRIALMLIALLTAMASAPGLPRAADNVFVQQDRTPLVSKPGVGGKIVAWVDTGFPLTILAQD